MQTITIRNVSAEPLDVRYWLGRTVDPDEAVDVDAEIVDRLPDAVVIEVRGGQQYALPRSRWSVEGDDGESVREVLARVGLDAQAAEAELAAEQDTERGGRGRVTLIRDLRKIAAGKVLATPADVAAADREQIRGGVLHTVDFAPGRATEANPLGVYAGTDTDQEV